MPAANRSIGARKDGCAGMTIAGGEFGLIRRIRQRMNYTGGRVVLGIGDDAAILTPPGGKLLASIDMLVEGIHFKKELITPWQLGWKALAVNISDIAAMGGSPLYALVSIGLDDSADDTYVDGIYEGLMAIANQFDVKIVGGDTVRSPKALVIDVAILGEAEAPVTRSGARPGDLIAVTGCLGNSAAGLTLLLQDTGYRQVTGRGQDVSRGQDIPPGQNCDRRQEPGPKGDWKRMEEESSWASELVQAHLQPVPRVAEGISLAGTGAVSAMIDISDGLSSEVNHIAEESNVGAVVYARDIPVSRALLAAAGAVGEDPLNWALFGGEDYELVFTFPSAAIDAVKEALGRSGGRVYVVGEVLPAGEGVTLVERDGSVRDLLPGGYNHFA
ncbi:MAG TPA: thiamine-phosphate kinase [Firmicutes bacterium]|nr:thiamine-phosphate kinase [Bacillota bacterium]